MKQLNRLGIILLYLLYPIVAFRWKRRCAEISEYEEHNFAMLVTAGGFTLGLNVYYFVFANLMPRSHILVAITGTFLIGMYALFGYFTFMKVTEMHDRKLFLK